MELNNLVHDSENIKLSQPGTLYKETTRSSPREVSVEIARLLSLFSILGMEVILENVIPLLMAIAHECLIGHPVYSRGPVNSIQQSFIY